MWVSGWYRPTSKFDVSVTPCRFPVDQQAALERLFVQVLSFQGRMPGGRAGKAGLVALDGTKPTPGHGVAATAALEANRQYETKQEQVRSFPGGNGGSQAPARAGSGPGGVGSSGAPGGARSGGGRHREEEPGSEAQGGVADPIWESQGEHHRSRQPHHEDSPGVRAGVQRPGSSEQGSDHPVVGYDVAVGMTLEANDVQQLRPMIQTLERNLEAAGIVERPRMALADAGYRSEANLTVGGCPGEAGVANRHNQV